MVPAKPRARLTREQGNIVLHLTDLDQYQRDRLTDVMLVNGAMDLHVARSDAEAYVMEWNSPANHYSLHIQTEDERKFERFLILLQDFLGVGIPNHITPE